MIRSRAAIIIFTLFSIAQASYAQSDTSDTSTQVGTWSCTYPYSHTGALTCPPVTFPHAFGGTPTVILTGCGSAMGQGYFCFNPQNIAPQDVGPLGFSPQILISLPYLGSSYVIAGNWTAVGGRVHYGTVTAKYMVVTVVYAPPGTAGGKSASAVSYAAGSTMGTTTSASQSFKETSSISFQASGGVLGNGIGAGLEFDFSSDVTDSQSLDIKKSINTTINWNGPSMDGINHDEDVIHLALNPTINLGLSSSGAQWILANTTPPIPIILVHVGWLRQPQTMPPQLAKTLNSAGFTSADFRNILARDPLANGSSAPDPARFVQLNTTFPYEPPFSATDPIGTINTTISDSSTYTTGTSLEDSYKVGLSISGTGEFPGLAQAALKDTASWEWTNKTSQSVATGTTQSASVTIAGPSFSYTGPAVVVDVYIDTIYHTFAFALDPVNLKEATVKGTVVDKKGNRWTLPKTDCFSARIG
jgi:hypothetical protein